MSKTEIKKIIEEYFSRDKLLTEETKKIRKIAMKNRIRLGEYRKRFCKKCFSDLRNAKVRLTKTHKIVTCENCNSIFRFRIF